MNINAAYGRITAVIESVEKKQRTADEGIDRIKEIVAEVEL